MAECKCGSDRILSVSGKCSDRSSAHYQGHEYNGYAPYNVGIGGGDYIELKVCMECGMVQGDFPVPHDVVLEAIDAGEEDV